MDIASLIGFFGGIFVLLFGIINGGEGLLSYVNPPSVFITFGGTICSTIFSFPISNIRNIPKLVGIAFREHRTDLNAVIDRLIQLANKARKDGLLSLEDAARELDDDFLEKGLMLIVDGTDPELVRNMLETELDFIEERHDIGAQMFDAMALFGPAFGMLGTLVGLIAMLQNMNDPTTVGPQMAIALVTTLYGSMIANMFAQPVATKLRKRSADEMLERQIQLEGLLSIQAGENPRIIEEKLKAFLPPSIRREPRQIGE